MSHAGALECWLPALSRFSAEHPLRQLLAKADRIDDGVIGWLPGLVQHFHVDGELPAAALLREALHGDAGDALWLCADPAWVQPDMTGARLLACGQLQLDQTQAESFASALLPALDEAGLSLHIGTPDRWQLRLEKALPLPSFAAPEQALGEDLYEHLPQGAEGKPWRLLFNEVQVDLHAHPLNAARAARGLPPVNALWLWGAGRLPHSVRSDLTGVLADDVLLRALAQRAGIAAKPRDAAQAMPAGWLLDLQDLDEARFSADWWPRLRELASQQALRLSFASGERWHWQPWQRLRFWRRAT